MLGKDVLYLLQTTRATNDAGDTISTVVRRPICGDKKSIRQSEFYQAQATGLKPEIMFEIWAFEYLDEPSLEYNSKTYTIIRTYTKDDEHIELVCAGVVNKG
jgi:SPP1 family predicted phage head-tail adaptor